MLIYFQKMSGGSIAINPKSVILVQEAPNGCDIVLSDGGTTRVTESYLNTVGMINAQMH